MKVLHVSCGGLGNGGVQSVIMSITRNLPHIKFDIILFTNEVRHHEHEFSKLGGSIYRIPNYEGNIPMLKILDYSIRPLRVFIRTYIILKRNGPYDAIHCHNNFESGICNLAALFARVKVRILHTHTINDKENINIFRSMYNKFLFKLLDKSTNYLIGCTNTSLESYVSNKSMAYAKRFILLNPIDLDYFQKRCTDKEIISCKILHVGQFNPNKNQMRIIEMMPILINEFPDIKLQLIGFGDIYMTKLYSKAMSLGVENHIQFLSAKTNVRKALEDVQLFVFPSKREGFGIAIVEAQAMKVKCLVSNTVPYEVDCGLCEFLNLDDGHEKWGEVAIQMIKDQEKYKLNPDKLNRFNLKNYTLAIKSIYEGR